MTRLWDENGEQVSTFTVEDDRVWMIVEKGREPTELHVFQTERVFFSKLVDTIRKDRLDEAVILISEKNKFLLKSISWEEIAIRVIRDEL